MSVQAFYRLKALITLEQVNTTKWLKKKESLLGKLRWSRVVNFHCMKWSSDEDAVYFRR